jgi:hypothetical protein
MAGRADYSRQEAKMIGIIFNLKSQPGSGLIAGSCAHCGKSVFEQLSTLDDAYNVFIGKCPHCQALNYLSMSHGLRGYSSTGMFLALPTPEEARTNELPEGIPLAPPAGPADQHGTPLGEILHRLTNED